METSSASVSVSGVVGSLPPSKTPMVSGGQMISVFPEELTFEYELEKPSYCNIKVVNNTEHHVAFKVKTTSPTKYSVRPNRSVVQPSDSCTIIVTLQPQKDYPPDMQCKDKFLIQSTKVPPTSDTDELPSGTFNKDSNKVIEELKLKVLYARAQSGHGNSEESGLASSASGNRGFDAGNLHLENNVLQMLLKHQRIIEELIEDNKKLQEILVKDLKVPPSKLHAKTNTKIRASDCLECRRRRRKATKDNNSGITVYVRIVFLDLSRSSGVGDIHQSRCNKNWFSRCIRF